MARNIFILILCAAVTFFLAAGYYESFRTGVLTIRGRSSRRDREPVQYWIGMIIGTFVFLVLASWTALMAFLVCVNLFGIR